MLYRALPGEGGYPGVWRWRVLAASHLTRECAGDLWRRLRRQQLRVHAARQRQLRVRNLLQLRQESCRSVDSGLSGDLIYYICVSLQKTSFFRPKTINVKVSWKILRINLILTLFDIKHVDIKKVNIWQPSKRRGVFETHLLWTLPSLNRLTYFNYRLQKMKVGKYVLCSQWSHLLFILL